MSLSVIYAARYKRLVSNTFFSQSVYVLSFFFYHIVCFEFFYEHERSSQVITAGPVNQFFFYHSKLSQ